MKAVRIETTGGPEVLQLLDVDVPQPGPGEILVRHGAIGVNFIDTYHRTGLYPLPLPSGLGLEAAGTVEAVGPGVTEFEIDDRVAYCLGPVGAYSEAHCVPAVQAVKLPELVDDATAAAMLLKGLTAEYLLRRTYPVQSGETILIHAAAGGVGLIACQWAKHLGATVIGTVGSEEKAELARSNGCDHTILYRTENVAARVRELTGGAGVPVVYDSVGKDMFEASLDCLRPRGMLVSYGNSSGAVTGVDLGVLSAKGSLYISRPTLFHYVATRPELDAAAKALFDVINAGAVRVDVRQRYPLNAVQDVHRDLEARKTTGASVMEP